MKRFIKNNPTKLILAGLFLVSWFLINLLGNSGVCFSEMRIFTDNEMMEFALKDKFDRGELKLDLKDTSVSAYLKNHPDCCYVYKSRGLFNLYGLLVGERDVHLVYALSDNSINAGGTHYEEDLFISACLEIKSVENRFGFTPNAPKPVPFYE